MKARGMILVLALLLAVPAMAQISGQYMESRTADVYTGPCFANSEVNLTGQEAVLGWHIDKGAWGNVSLDGLSVVAVVRASATLGDPFANPLPAKAVLVVDERASNSQRAALVNFAQAQTGALLSNVVAIQALPIQFSVDANHHGSAAMQAGNLALLSTRPISSDDEICHNEEVYYPPLAAHLTHAMPAVEAQSTYRDALAGGALGVNWSESGRRSSFVGTFSF